MPKKRLANLGQRFMALAVDMLFVTNILVPIIAFPTFIIINKLLESGYKDHPVMHVLVPASIIFIIAIIPIYFIWMHMHYRATLGKRVLSVRLARLDGKPLTIWNCVIRFIPIGIVFYLILNIMPTFDVNHTPQKINPLTAKISAVVFCTWVITSMLSIFIDRYRRAPHDFLAKTVVIKA